MDTEKNDITTRKDIERMVHAFYDKVKTDKTIGFIFNDIVKTNWDHHLPVMIDFWETILLDNVLYTKNAMSVHYEVNRVVPFEDSYFTRWLQLFDETVEELFTGTRATLAKTRARSIAQVMQFKMQQENNGLRIKH